VTLTVEDGTGLANADAYVSLATAATYASARAWTDWAAAADATKEAAIREATVYLDTSYQWRGSIISTAQALAWPREGVTDAEGRDITGVPARVRDACCELARQQLGAALVTSRTEGEVQSLTAGSVSITYAKGSRVSEGERFAWVDRLLRGLHSARLGSGGNIPLTKA
jgi:hypothetical protein